MQKSKKFHNLKLLSCWNNLVFKGMNFQDGVSAQNYRISNFLYKVVLDLTAAVSKNVTHHESTIMLLCWPSFAVKHAISWKSFER